MADKRPALGRGLSALIPDAPAAPAERSLDVDIDLLRPNRFQPRTAIDERSLPTDSAICSCVRCRSSVRRR